MLVTQKDERVECFSTVLELSGPLSTYKYPFVKFVFFVHLYMLLFSSDNPSTVPGVDNSAYYSTSNSQYHDDAEEFLLSEVSSHYGDLLVS